MASVRPLHAALIASAMALGGCRLIDAAREVEVSSDASPVSDGGGFDGACGTVSLVDDDFEDGAVGDGWAPFFDEGAEVEEKDGVLRVLFSGDTTAWGGYNGSRLHDVAGGALAAQVQQVGGLSLIELRGGTVKAQFFAGGGNLVAAVLVGGETMYAFEQEYLAGTHVHWRMREAHGTLHFETSVDGADWSEFDVIETPLATDSVRATVSAAGVDGDPAAEFEAATIDLEAPAGPCPVDASAL